MPALASRSVAPEPEPGDPEPPSAVWAPAGMVDPATTTAHADRLVGLMLAAGRAGVGRHQVFADFLRCCHAALDHLPALVSSLGAGAGLPPEPEPELWEEMGRRYGDAVAAFSRGLGLLIDAAGEGYQDVIGTAYMRGELGGDHGQYFTPSPVAGLMAAALHDPAELRARVEAALGSDAALAALVVTGTICADADSAHQWWAERVAPRLVALVEPVVVVDPTVGSGVMLLAAASCYPRWAVGIGLVRFCGMDLDATCVSMTRLNFRLHGLRGPG